MWNLLTRVTSFLVHLFVHRLAFFIPWRTDENSIETARTNAKTENDELKQQLDEKEKELEGLKSNFSDLRTRNDELQGLLLAKENDFETFRMDYNDLRTRNDELQRLLHEMENGWETLRTDYNDLRTRLSEIGAMQLTEGNPNITDLSDQNRPDKIAEQFSELYDNQWTDCYMVLMDRLTKSEQETVETLLTIIKTIYDISLNRSQQIMSDARKVLVAFAGMSDGESEKALDSLIQETLHKMKSYRTKHFKAVPKDIAKEINEKLVKAIGGQEVTACSEYIEACVRTCWLMCIKDPPMYIFCEKEDVFNKNHFMEYTEKGHKVSYVVWPVLYLYENGPLMRKGVAQGEGEQIEDSKVAGTEDGSPNFSAFVENNSQFSTGTSENPARKLNQPNGDDNAEIEVFANKLHYRESRQICVSLNTIEDSSLQEHGSEQKVGTRDIIVTVAEGNSSTEPSKKNEEKHLREAVDSLDVNIQVQDDVRSQTANETIVESSLLRVVEGLGHEHSNEGNAAHVSEEKQSEQSGHNVNGIKTLKIGNDGREESIQQKYETHNQEELYHTQGNIVSKGRDDCRNKEAEDKIAVKDQDAEQVKSSNTDVTNAICLCKTDDQGSRTTQTEAGAEREVDESGKEEDVEINMQLLHNYEMELRKKTNDVVLLEYKTRAVDNVRDTDAPHSLDESCEGTDERFVSPCNDKDKPEVNDKEENLRVADVCSFSENIVPGQKDAEYNNLNVAVATADGVANPTVELQKETLHQGKSSEDSSAEGH